MDDTKLALYQDNMQMATPSALCPNLLDALVKAMGETGYVQKAKDNTQQRYKYAGEEDFIKHVRPALIKHGLLLIGPHLVGDRKIIDKPTNSGGVMWVFLQDFEWELVHVSGERWPWPLRMTGEGMDSGDKSIYKACTGAYKYVISKLLMIATGDDPESDQDEAPQAATSKPAPRSKERELTSDYNPVVREAARVGNRSKEQPKMDTADTRCGMGKYLTIIDWHGTRGGKSSRWTVQDEAGTFDVYHTDNLDSQTWPLPCEICASVKSSESDGNKFYRVYDVERDPIRVPMPTDEDQLGPPLGFGDEPFDTPPLTPGV